jgi:hypothetical protein
MLQKVLFFIFIFCIGKASTQELSEAYLVNHDFGKQENLKYKVSYNLGFIWIDAGFVEFNVVKTTYHDKKVFHFLSTGISEKKWEWIYKVRDTFEVYAETENLKPIYFNRNTQEGGVFKHDNYRFDYNNNTIYTERMDKNYGIQYDTILFKNFTYDLLSATYFARAMDFSKNLVGDTIPINIIYDGGLVILPIVYHGKATIYNQNNTSIPCIKFSAIMNKSTMFQSNEKITVWVTDDEYKIPVLIEAKIIVGSIQVQLISSQLKQ